MPCYPCGAVASGTWCLVRSRGMRAEVAADNVGTCSRCPQAPEAKMLERSPLCRQAVFDGGVDDPRTRVYLYQQRLRAELLGKVAEAERRPWWSTAPLVVSGPIRSIMALRRARYAAQASEGFVARPFVWAYHRPRHQLGLVTLQGRILGAVAAGLLSRGTVFDIAAQLCTGKAALCAALRALRDGGWVAVQLLPDEWLVVRLERRRAGEASALMLNRRVHADAWAL
jgi:hypothetical protein